MDKFVNDIIVKENFKQFILNGGLSDMNYWMDEDFNKQAEGVVSKSILKTKVGRLNKTLENLHLDETQPIFSKTCLTDEESRAIKTQLDNLNGAKEKIMLQKQMLETCKEKALADFDLSKLSKYVEEIKEIDKTLAGVESECKTFASKIDESGAEYKNQMEDLKVAMGNFNFQEASPKFDEKYSANVVSDFKEQKAREYVKSFISDLTPSEQEQVLNENENLKRYYSNVGENI